MPGKSRRGRHKHSARIRKRQGVLAKAVPEHVPVETREPVVSAVPSAGVRTPVAASPSTRYHYIITELRTIGILAGIMIVILVVLALVLT